MRMPERTVLMCVAHASRPHGMKLNCESRTGKTYFRKDDIDEFLADLEEPWASTTNGGKPKRAKHAKHFVEALRYEVGLKCGLCGKSEIGELAHIEPWASCLHNHPWNLLYLCKSCHDGYDIEKRISKSEVKRAKELATTNVLDSLRFSLTFEKLLSYLQSIKAAWHGVEVNGIDFLLSCISLDGDYCRIEKCRLVKLLELLRKAGEGDSQDLGIVFTRLVEVSSAHISSMRICEPFWEQIAISIHEWHQFPDVRFQLNALGLELVQYLLDRADDYVDATKYSVAANGDAKMIVKEVARQCHEASEYCDSKETLPMNRLDDLAR